MHEPPFTIDEIAATIGREVAELRQHGIPMNKAVRVVAERNRTTVATATQLLMRQRGNAQRRAARQAAA